MKIDIKTDHGLVVWAKMSKNAHSWAALIISMEKMDLLYKETPNKTWVFWLQNENLSQLNNNLIFDFFLDFESHSKCLKNNRKAGVLEAIKIVSSRFGFDIPEEINKADSLVPWMSDKIKDFNKNNIGECLQSKAYIIPEHVIHRIRYIHDKNKQVEIQQKIENLKKREYEEIRKICLSKDKKKCQLCVACRRIRIENKQKHPIFQGFICEDCYKKAKLFLFTIAEDGTNECCCICFNVSCSQYVCCEICVRSYCKVCVSMYSNVSSAFEKVIKHQNWSCFSCVNPSRSFSWGLQRLSFKEQIQNIYSLYPAEKTESFVAKDKIQKLHVLTFNDYLNTVSEILESLQHPYLIENCSKHCSLVDRTSGPIKLLLGYYPTTEENINKIEDNASIMLERFFEFILVRDRLKIFEYGHNPYNMRIFWAFECSASITNNLLETINRFCEKEPIIVGMKTKKIRQRARFIWTNIMIPEQFIEESIDSSIFIRNLTKKELENIKDNKGWCYSSIYTILSSLIYSNI